MNEFERKEQLEAISLLGMAKQLASQYANPCDQKCAAEAALQLAAQYARTGADLTVLKVLEYPDTKRADPDYAAP